MKTLVCGLALAVLSARAGNVYVSETGSYTTDDGETHEAWTDLQDALNAAAAGDTVWVEDGYEWDPGENRYTDATYGGRVLGVPKAMTVRSRSGKWETGVIVRGRWNSAETPKGANALCGVCLAKNAKIMGFRILDCAANTSLVFNHQAGVGLVGTLDATAENCFIANCRANYGAASYYVDLKNCVVSNCNATTYATFTYGGGAKDCLFIDNNVFETGANAVRYGHNYERCTFVNNSGTGVLIDADGTTYPTAVTDCVFSNNTIACIGAAHRKNKRVIVRNCLFANNTGSAFLSHYQDTKYFDNIVTAYNCTIVNNTFSTDSTVHGLSMPGDYYNCLIADNTCRGVLIGHDDPGSGIRLLNCTVVDNTSGTSVSPVANARVSAINSILDGNAGKTGTTPTLGAATSCVLDFTAATETDCQHVDPALVNRAGGLYQPGDASPCLGAGSLTAYDLTETDLAGRPRLTDGKVSIGAYEYDPSVKYVEAAVTGYPKYLYAPAGVSFAASVCGLGTQGVLFHWDFDNDGTVDYITSRASFTYALGVGDYDPTLYISNATEGVSYRLDTTFSILARPTRYVKDGNEGAEPPYATEETAAPDIATAVAFCSDGDAVVILPGTYEISEQIVVDKELIVGGATGKPEDVVIHETANDRCLQICGGEECLVHSLTVENGKRSATFDFGSGVYMAVGTYAKVDDNYYPSAGSGTLSNVIVRACSQSSKFCVCPGVYANGPKCFVTHCQIVDNTSSSSYSDGGFVQGVGLHLTGGARAENCLVARNVSDNSKFGNSDSDLWTYWHDGQTQAAVFVGDGSSIRYSTIVSNAMSFCGGVNVNGSGFFEKCVIAGNIVTEKTIRESSDRYTVWAAFPYVMRSLKFYHGTVAQDFEQNVKDYIAAEQAAAAASEALANKSYNAVDVDGLALGAGTVFATAPELFRSFPRNFRLRNDSPAVDVVPEGSELNMPSLDLLGNPRLVNGAYDLGCFEKAESRGLLMMFR